MKNLSIDEQRELLNRRKEEYKHSLTTSVEETKAEIGSKLQTIAFAAGAVLLGYLVVKVVDELTHKKEEARQPSEQPPVQMPIYQPQPPAQHEAGFSFTNFLKEQLAFFLVSLAKDKMYELIDFALHNLRHHMPAKPAQEQAENE
ncbi:hypothetical protein [Rhodoflexus caldus]|uniref:hypothetical protein n=1 Tax=Rhodoflexus caldus TaxID=2891236 RepID=UPI00202A4145|nr:hypothetical protein [Rhodoflexus caldus]